MSELVKMPSLSPHMRDGVLRRWNVKPGDVVQAEDVIAEVETDKASFDLVAEVSGRVVELLTAEGQRVPVGTPVAQLEPLPQPQARTA
jgi:pyruvate/2-oxoglutarate dehydrogenase complex dihydrolipoamide acyltransferase (E2) component